MNLLSLSGVAKTFRDEPLFQDVTLGIDEGEKIGFIGKNGSGKSTFLKLLSGEMEPDSGVVARNRALTVAVLPQIPVFEPGATVDEYLAADGGPLEAGRSLCRELGIVDTKAAMGVLSGGTARKAALARCLALDARLLVLDEPTNHLDLQTIEWLESYLAAADRSFVLVTHDRYFLDAVCTGILEIDGRRIYKYPGSYTTYLERRAERAAAAERAEERRVTVLRREIEWLKRGPKARRGKDKGRIERAQALMEGPRRAEPGMDPRASAHRRLGKKVVELTGAGKSYDGRVVISPFTYSFRRGERIGVVGPNGSGKTTLLHLVSGRIPPDTGSVVKGETTVFAHFDQSSASRALPLTVLEYIREHGERIGTAEGGTVTAEQFLERFLFPRPLQATRLERLSGGELRRLELVRIFAQAPNFLVMDEPTNDLDLQTIELLEDYLEDFPGCLLVVSHDRALLDRLTDYLFVLDGRGGVQPVSASYTAWRETQEVEVRATSARAEPARPRPAKPKSDALTWKERREYEQLMEDIGRLEQEQKELEALFQQPALEPARLEASSRRYQEVESQIREMTERWEALAARDGA